jgi:hypothetical protein
MDTIGLANLPGEAGSAAEVIKAAVLWLASTGPVGAYLLNGSLLLVGILILGYQAATVVMALALQAESASQAPLIRELGNFVRSSMIACYERALQFVDAVDKEMDDKGPRYMSEPQQSWRSISDTVVRPFLHGTNLKVLASPAFSTHSNLYAFQHELYVQMETYNRVMSIVMQTATRDILDIDFNVEEYRSWAGSDESMRCGFIRISARGKFSELCTLVGPTWGEKERKEWKGWVEKRSEKGSRCAELAEREN